MPKAALIFMLIYLSGLCIGWNLGKETGNPAILTMALIMSVGGGVLLGKMSAEADDEPEDTQGA